MRTSNAQLLADPKPLGVIDTVSAGLDLVRRRPWTLLIPLLLDTMLWLLPRLSLASLFRSYAANLFDATGAPPDVAANLEQARQTFMQFADSLNLMGMVVAALNTVARMPTLLALSNTEVFNPIPDLAFVVPVESGGFALLLFIPLFLLGLLAAALYIEWIAQGVRPLEKQGAFAWVYRVSKLWLNLIALSLALALLLVGSVILLGVGQFVLGSDGVNSFLAALVAVGFFWIFIYLFYAISALAIGNVGLRQALQRSLMLFRLFFWPSLGLVILTVFLDRGLTLIWAGLTVTPVGAFIGILANAYIGTSLLAASMVYYQDRMNLVDRIRARARPNRA